MIYDPITSQQVTIIGRYPPQKTATKFGRRLKGDFLFANVRYGDYIRPDFKGGFPIGEERDVDSNTLVADEGSLEISKAMGVAPVIKQ